jgi:hypothetical protein
VGNEQSTSHEGGKRQASGRLKRYVMLMYEGKIAGFDGTISYEFVKDRLARAAYISYPKHTNKNNFISDYDRLRKSLTKKYRKPFRDDVIRHNDLYGYDYQEWGLARLAISFGHLRFWTLWETPTTDIALGLLGENYKINLLTIYESKELRDLLKEVKEQKVLDGF